MPPQPPQIPVRRFNVSRAILSVADELAAGHAPESCPLITPSSHFCSALLTPLKKSEAFLPIARWQRSIAGPELVRFKSPYASAIVWSTARSPPHWTQSATSPQSTSGFWHAPPPRFGHVPRSHPTDDSASSSVPVPQLASLPPQAFPMMRLSLKPAFPILPDALPSGHIAAAPFTTASSHFWSAFMRACAKRAVPAAMARWQ